MASDANASSTRSMDLHEVLDGQKVQRSSIIFLVITILAMISDGFDIAAMGLVAPELVKQWHVSSKDLVPAFSAGVFGLFLGAPLLGYLGDRLGRKTSLLIGLCSFGLFTLCTMAATSLDQFVVLRFLTGLGLGGMIPNAIALTAEIAPKRFRGMFVIIINFGVPAGMALPGFVAALLVPHYGWQVLMLVGGALPLAVALLVAVQVRESIRFLMQRGGREEVVRSMVQALRPDLSIPTGTRFTVPAAAMVEHGHTSPKKLFAGGLAFITPLLWIALAANQLTNFFTVSWLPTILQSSGLSSQQAGVSASMFATGGLIGGFILTFIIDRVGILPVVLFFLFGAPLVASIGIPGLSPFALAAIIAGAGFCVTGNNFAINAVMGMIYPTPVRSMGTGWAMACGRLGALIAQFAGGILLGMHLPSYELYFVPAGSLVVGAVASGALAILCVRNFGGTRIEEASMAVPAQAPAAALAEVKSPA